jgi:hypothetical protein
MLAAVLAAGVGIHVGPPAPGVAVRRPDGEQPPMAVQVPDVGAVQACNAINEAYPWFWTVLALIERVVPGSVSRMPAAPTPRSMLFMMGETAPSGVTGRALSEVAVEAFVRALYRGGSLPTRYDLWPESDDDRYTVAIYPTHSSPQPWSAMVWSGDERLAAVVDSGSQARTVRSVDIIDPAALPPVLVRDRVSRAGSIALPPVPVRDPAAALAAAVLLVLESGTTGEPVAVDDAVRIEAHSVGPLEVPPAIGLIVLLGARPLERFVVAVFRPAAFARLLEILDRHAPAYAPPEFVEADEPSIAD